jgi:hypothetical protein
VSDTLRELACRVTSGKRWFKWATFLCYASSIALIAEAVWKWGAGEVRGHSDEVVFLTFFGFIWLIFSAHLCPWFGLSFEDDVLERRNTAALIALFAATVASAILYASGNLGEGPSYWNNVFSAALGISGFFALWLIFEIAGHVSVSIAEERDVASGVRFAGFLLAIGLMLGRAIAGDWDSESATLRDFCRDGWPALALCLVASVAEHFLRPSRARPAPGWLSFGLLPGLAYFGSACEWVFHLGPWEGMPK